MIQFYLFLQGRKSLFSFLLLFHFWLELSGQRFEFGGGAGILSYRGDLQTSYLPVKPAFAAELIGRYNFSMAAVARINLLLCPQLSASSSGSGDYQIRSQDPPYGFSSFLAEIGAFGEYNFFNYRNPKSRYIFGTPYLFGGPSFALMQNGITDEFEQDSIYLSNLPPEYQLRFNSAQKIVFIPGFVLGVGYKQQIGQYFNLGLQASGRFLFTDEFDRVSDREKSSTWKRDDTGTPLLDAEGNPINTPVLRRQLGNKFDRDAYFYLGFSLTYTIKEIICPFKYETKPEK
jgi:hypothetical protein